MDAPKISALNLRQKLESIMLKHTDDHVDPGHDLSHVRRVAAWMVRLDPALPQAEVEAAAFLHDVINLPKNSPDRADASRRSADVARDELPRLGFEAGAVERVAQAIEDHSYSRGVVPRSELGRVLQDADRLEALGAIGLMRTFSTGALMGAAYFAPGDPWAVERELDDLRFTIDHFATKLLGLASTLNTDAGRAEGSRRVATMRGFLDALGDELGEPCPPRFGAT